MEDRIQFIDRDWERKLFHDMLKFDTSVRLLTIEAAGGRGKSSLLAHLQSECESKLDIPVTLIPLNDPDLTDSFTLVKRMRNELYQFTRAFLNFDTLDNARMLKNPTPFNESISRTAYVSAEGAQLSDQAVVAGHIRQLVQRVDNMTIQFNLEPREQWPSEDYEIKVRDDCIDAFFLDLKTICDEMPVVMLFDVWEDCPTPLGRFITRRMLNHLCFDRAHRPQQLVFVVAGRKIPPFKNRLGDDYDNLVTSIDKLSDWTVEHLRDFIQAHGYEDVEDNIVTLIYQRLNSDDVSKTLTWALDVVDAWTGQKRG